MISFRRQERDDEILKAVHRFRLLDSEMIRCLIPGSNQGITRRLKKLTDHRFLDRPLVQEVYKKKYKTRYNIYGLGDGGAEVLAVDYGYEMPEVHWKTKNDDLTARFMHHFLMISKFMVNLEIYVRKNPGVELTRDQKDGEYFFTYRNQSGKEQRLYPDRYFSLEYEDLGKEKKEVVYCLEADNATKTYKQFLENQQKPYGKLWPKVEERFMVLNVIPSRRRMEGLREELMGRDWAKRGSMIYWFTTLDSFDYHQPEVLFEEPIWRWAKDSSQLALHPKRW